MNDVRKFLNKYELVIKKYRQYNNVFFIDTNDGKICLKKKKNNNVFDIIKYLKSRHFNNFLEFNSRENDDFYMTRFINDSILLEEDRAMELVYLVSLLHNRTTFYKSISLDEVKCFYEDKINEIERIKSYYDNLCYLYIDNVFLSPSKYLLIRNISLIFKSLDLSKKYLDMWYEIMKNKKSKRIVLNHNNLSLSHILVDNNSYLINWDNACFDVPIIDLCSFFKNEFLNIDIQTMFNVYFSKYQLFKEEICLLYCNLLICSKIEFFSSEIENCKNVYMLINYINKVNDFILENSSSCEKK